MDSAVNLSFVLDGVRSYRVFPSAQGTHTGDFDAIFTLAVHVFLMMTPNYFNCFLTGFRALLSTDLTESAAALYLLFQAITAVLPPKKEIRKLTENEINSGSFSSSEVNFCLLFLLLCFLSFSPSYKEHIIKEWMLIGLSLNHMPQEKKKSTDSTSDSAVEIGNMLISSLCS